MTENMKPYIGVKKVNARPMTDEEFAAYRDKIRKSEAENALDGVSTGYLVEHANGYISWSPKNVFEEAYVNVTKFGDGVVFGRMNGGELHVGYGDTLEDAVTASETTISIENETGQFDFSYALQLLLKGASVRRVDWADNVFLKYRPENDSHPASFNLYEDGVAGSNWLPLVEDLTEVCWEFVEDK